MPVVIEMRVGHNVKYQNSQNGDLIATPKLERGVNRSKVCFSLELKFLFSLDQIF